MLLDHTHQVSWWTSCDPPAHWSWQSLGQNRSRQSSASPSASGCPSAGSTGFNINIHGQFKEFWADSSLPQRRIVETVALLWWWVAGWGRRRTRPQGPWRSSSRTATPRTPGRRNISSHTLPAEEHHLRVPYTSVCVCASLTPCWEASQMKRSSSLHFSLILEYFQLDPKNSERTSLKRCTGTGSDARTSVRTVTYRLVGSLVALGFHSLAPSSLSALPALLVLPFQLPQVALPCLDNKRTCIQLEFTHNPYHGFRQNTGSDTDRGGTYAVLPMSRRYLGHSRPL